MAVDFDYRMERTPQAQQLFARLMGTLVRKESLRHLERAAVARVVEHSARMLGDNGKLLTHMRSLSDMLRESDYQAAQ